MSTLVCIPAFNEGKVIGDVIRKCLEVSDQVVVCDDGSTDNTYEVSDLAGAHVIRHHKNIGKGEALQTLFKFAMHSKNDIIVTIDGDGQFLPEEIPKLIRDIEKEKSDIVIGYRFDDATDMPNYRRFGNKVLDKMANMVTEIPVRDTQSGYRAYSKDAIEKLDFKMKGFGADVEILMDAAKKGLNISEQKVTVIYNTGAQTSTKNPISHTGEVMSTILEKIAIKSPLKYLGIPGIITIILGIYFAINVIVTYNDIGYFSIPFTLIGATFLVLGLILFLMATILFSVSKRLNKKS
jgi:glycosyltransferase involved in cell wall biosynthesis